MADEVGEGAQFQQVLAGGRLVYDFMFKNPSEVVGNEDGVKTGAERGIDV